MHPVPILGCMHAQSPLSGVCRAKAETDTKSQTTASQRTDAADVTDSEPQGVSNVFAQIAIVLVSIVLLTGGGVWAATSILYKFEDQLSSFFKKDFIPYSERKAAEADMLHKRDEADELAASDGKVADSREFTMQDIKVGPLQLPCKSRTCSGRHASYHGFLHMV